MVAKLTDTMNWEEIAVHVMNRLEGSIKKPEQAKFKKWFLAREGVGYLIDPTLILRAYNIWKEIKNHLDHFVCIEGREGFGKTTLAFALAAWVDPSFCLTNVCYGAQDYLEILSKKAEAMAKGEHDNINTEPEAAVMDEGTELLSREAMNITNRTLTKTFFVQRALGFLIIINIPNFFMLDSGVRLHRVRTLITVTNRGQYKAITGTGIPYVCKEGMRIKNVNKVRLKSGTFWHGTFNKDFPKLINRAEYEQFKLDSITRLLCELKGDVVPNKFVSVKNVAKECTFERTATIIDMIKSGKLKGKQIGKKWVITRDSYNELVKV